MTTNDIDAIREELRRHADATGAGRAYRSRTLAEHVPARCDEIEQLRAEREHMELNPTGTAEWLKHRVNELTAELAKVRAELAKPCGSCHPCTNYRDETWRAANRKPPHVIEWDDAQDELKALRPVVGAARVWRQWYGNTNASYASACNDLTAAVDALPSPAEHLDICPGYGCPGCRNLGEVA